MKSKEELLTFVPGSSQGLTVEKRSLETHVDIRDQLKRIADALEYMIQNETQVKG